MHSISRNGWLDSPINFSPPSRQGPCFLSVNSSTTPCSLSGSIMKIISVKLYGEERGNCPIGNQSAYDHRDGGGKGHKVVDIDASGL